MVQQQAPQCAVAHHIPRVTAATLLCKSLSQPIGLSCRCQWKMQQNILENR